MVDFEWFEIENILSMAGKPLPDYKKRCRSLDYKLPAVKIPESLIKALKPHGLKRFVKVEKPIEGNTNTGKSPFEREWQNNLYLPDDPSLVEWLESGGNYGIAFGNGLIGIDADFILVNRALEDLKTFGTRSGRSGDPGKHRIFISNIDGNVTLYRDPKKRKRDNNVGHIQVKNKILVAPGSLHFTGKRYEIVDDFPIASISKDDLKKRLGQFMKSESSVKRAAIRGAKHENNLVGNQIPLTRIIDTNDFIQISKFELQGSHPIHGSTTGQNFCVNLQKNSWFCFRDGSGGGALLWLLIKHGVIDCAEAGAGKLRGELFEKSLELAEEEGFELDLEQSTITSEIAKKYFKRSGNKLLFMPAWLASEIMEEHTFLTRIEDKCIFMYQPETGTYDKNGEILIEIECKKRLADEYRPSRSMNVIKDIMASTYTNPPETPLHLIAFKNGLYNIETKQLEPFSSEYFILNQHPVVYDPSAKCPRWMQYLEETIDDKENIAVFQEWFGFCFYRNYFIKAALILIGGHDAGKTTGLNVLAEILGNKYPNENIAAVSLHELQNNKFKTAELFGKNANICPDISKLTLRDLDKFKAATGKDTLEAEFKFSSSFRFQSYAKLTYGANTLPELPTDEKAPYSRIMYIDFPNQFLRDDPNTDHFLDEKLRKEYSGILNWSLIGLNRILKNRKFSKHMTVDQTIEAYTIKSNPTRVFVDAHLTSDYEGSIYGQRLYDIFVEFCGNNNVNPPMRLVFDKKLKEYMPGLSKRRGNKGVKWFGLKLLDIHDEDEENEEPQKHLNIDSY